MLGYVETKPPHRAAAWEPGETGVLEVQDTGSLPDHNLVHEPEP